MEGNCRIRELRKEEIGEALDLVSRVFQSYEVPDYTEEGVETFNQSIHEESYLAQLRWYGAFAPEGLVGVLATKERRGPHRPVLCGGEAPPAGHREASFPGGGSRQPFREDDGELLPIRRPGVP